MTTIMMKKIEEAKKMVSTLCEEDGLFIPSQYNTWHLEWGWKYHGEGETPVWATLKKYASEIGLIAVDCVCAWHSDGQIRIQRQTGNFRHHCRPGRHSDR